MVERKDSSKEIPLRWRFCNDISHSCWRPTVQILPLSKTSLLPPTSLFDKQHSSFFYVKHSFMIMCELWCTLIQVFIIRAMSTLSLDCPAETHARLYEAIGTGTNIDSVYVALLISWGIKLSHRFVSRLKTFLLMSKSTGLSSCACKILTA